MSKYKKVKENKIKKTKKKWGTMVPYMLGMFTKKADTTAYPAVKAKVADDFRGMLAFKPELCVGCKLCERVCPTDAIKITKTEDKKYIAVVEMDKCIFCGQCVDSCNKDSLINTANFELASDNKKDLSVQI